MSCCEFLREGTEMNEFGRYIIRVALSVVSYLETEKDGNNQDDSDSPGNEEARRIS